MKSFQQPRFEQHRVNVSMPTSHSHLPHPTFQPFKVNPPPDSLYKPHGIAPLASPRVNAGISNSFSQPIKQFEARMEGVVGSNKKMSAHLDPSQILPPGVYSSQQHLRKTSFDDPNHQPPAGSHQAPPSPFKEDLRTSYTTTNIAPKFMDKDFLRKTTFTPLKGMFGAQQPSQPQFGGPSHAPSGLHLETSPKMFAKKHFESSNSTAEGSLAVSQSPSFKHLKSQHNSSPVVCGFELGRVLGSGKFGQVYIARHVASGFIVALKKIVKAKVKEFNMIAQLTQEIKLHAFLSHPNIVQFYGFVSDQQNVYIILEYMEGGTLFDYMNDKERLYEAEAVVFLREVTHAVKYLHDINIAHRDIKPENIVLSYGVAKLCDFGWSARVQGARKTYCGTFDYAPPEILQRKEYDQTVDLWCLGVLAYEMMTGKVPFEHEERKVVMQKIVNVDKGQLLYPKDLSLEARDFIQCLIKKIPTERTKSYKLVSHPFLLRSEKDKVIDG